MKFAIEGAAAWATDAKARQAAADALNATAAHGVSLVVESSPVRSARLRNSIQADEATPQSLEAAVSTNVEYAAAVEYGTGVHSEFEGAPKQPIVIKAKNGKALVFKFKGETILRRSVTIQGQKPAAMFRNNLPAMEARLEEEMAAALEGLGFV